MSVEVVQKSKGYLLEGPHWDDVTNTLLYVDIHGKTIHRYDPATKAGEKVIIDDKVGCVVPTRTGRLLAGSGHRFCFVDWKTGNVEVIHEIAKDKKIRFNDGKCDPFGRFWAGTSGEEVDPSDPMGGGVFRRQGTLYCLHQDKKVVPHVENLDVSNGLAWSADRKTMYFIDSTEQGVHAFDYNVDNGDIANRRQVIEIPPSDGIPDGMSIDSKGMLWVALFSGAAVNRYDPNTGEKLRTIKFPTDNITSCCWGGKNHDELYVTSAKHYLTEEQLKQQVTAGSLFRVTGLGVQGVKGNIFDDSKF